MQLDRRNFLHAAATSDVASSATNFITESYAQVAGANERVCIAFLGVGGRCQQDIDPILTLQWTSPNNVRPVAGDDVWHSDATLGSADGRGLYRSARNCDNKFD